MSINIGLYNFFGYTIPGLFYLFIGVYGAVAFGYIQVDYTLVNNLSVLSALVIAGSGYVTGMVMDWVAEQWHAPFKGKRLTVKSYEKFHYRYHQSVTLKLKANEWPLYLAFLRKQGREHMLEIERFNVNRIMLRNISLGLMLLAAIHLSHLLFVRFYPVNLWIGIGYGALSIFAAIKGVEFAEWYFIGMFEAVAAEGMTVEDFFKIASPSQAEISSITDKELPATRETAVSGKQELLHRKDQRSATRPQVRK